jgi:hypothetical protein
VLVHPHATRHAVHDDAKSLYSHKYLFCVCRVKVLDGN